MNNDKTDEKKKLAIMKRKNEKKEETDRKRVRKIEKKHTNIDGIKKNRIQ